MSPAPRQPFRSTREGEDPSKYALRIQFLKSVDELVPDAAQKLVEVVGEKFVALRLATSQADQDEDPHPDLADDPASQSEELGKEVAELLIRWAKPYNLHHDHWILNHALDLLSWYHAREDLGGLRKLGTALPTWEYWPEGFPGFAYPVPAPELSDPTEIEERGDIRDWVERERDARLQAAMDAADWDTPPLWPYQPLAETREEFLERADEYADWIENAYRARGWRPKEHLPEAKMHLRWLARYQVPREGYPNGERISDIAASPQKPGQRTSGSRNERTVREQCRRMAERIGLTRRSRVSGR